MLVNIDERQAAELLAAADSIYKLFAFAEGQEDSYDAMRKSWYEAIEESPFPETLAGIRGSSEIKNAPSDEEAKQEETENRKQDEKAILIPKKKEEKKLLKVSDFKKRQRKNSIEARCMYYGKAISISAKTNTELNNRLREYVREFNELNKPTAFPVVSAKQAIVPAVEEPKPIIFKDYALEYVEVMKKLDVADSWYSRVMSKFRLHIFPFIAEKILSDISGFDCKIILDTLRKANHYRTAEEVHGLLKQIFDFAQSEGVLTKTPMARIKFKRAERQHKRCLSMVEEAHLLSIAKGTRYECHVVLMLYAGLRPGECNSAYIEGDFIIARNLKRRNGKIEWKRIPITPMMRKYIPLLSESFKPLSKSALQNWFYDMDWDMQAYYCRHTFNTRLGKFKVDKELRELAMGHKSAAVNIETYMHYSENLDTFYMEFQKVEDRKSVV